MVKIKKLDIVLKNLPEDEALRILMLICKERDIIELWNESKDGKETLLDGSHIFGATTTPLIDIPTTIKVSRMYLQKLLTIFEVFDEDYVELGFTKDSPLMCKLKIDTKVVYLYLAPRMVDE